MQYPTQGDLAREQVHRHGFLFFDDVENEVRDRLTRLPAETRATFALACATRLMTKHERLPASEQRPFTLGWRPVIDIMWSGLADEREDALQGVREALRAYHDSPYDHDDGPDGPQDADEDAAAASIYAAECFTHGAVEDACWAAGRAVEAAFRVAQRELQLDPNDFIWDPDAEPMPLAKESMHPAVQSELRRQLADLEELERAGVTTAVLQRLRQA
jgi:hypothetical protein